MFRPGTFHEVANILLPNEVKVLAKCDKPTTKGTHKERIELRSHNVLAFYTTLPSQQV